MKTDDPVFKLLTEFCGQSAQVTIPRALISLTGDLKTAMVLSQVVYWSGKKDQSDGWFYKTYDQWNEELALSKHEVSRAVDWLSSEGLVEFETRKEGGVPKLHYHFSISGFRKWIVKKGEVDSEKIGDLNSEKPEVPNKEQKNTPEEYKQKNTEEPPPEENGTITGIENQEPFDREALPKLLCSRFKRLRGVRSFPKSCRDLVQRCTGILNSNWSEDQVLSVFEDWESEEFWRSFTIEHKVHSFFKYTESHSPRQKTELLEPPGASPQPEIPVLVTATPVAPAIDFPARWNELVPARPTVWNQARDSWRGVGVFSDPEFAAKFDDLCRTCQKFITAKPDADWVHFRWMIGAKDGHPNWHRVDSDEFHISEKRHGSGMTAEEKGQMTRNLAKQMEEENETRKKAAAQKS
jgi:hypothetical protein